MYCSSDVSTQQYLSTSTRGLCLFCMHNIEMFFLVQLAIVCVFFKLSIRYDMIIPHCNQSCLFFTTERSVDNKKRQRSTAQSTMMMCLPATRN